MATGRVPHRPVEAGEQLALSEDVALRAIATPGHTPDHLVYLLSFDGQPVGLWSGGALMVSALGRTDLLGDDLARRLFRSLRSEILVLPRRPVGAPNAWREVLLLGAGGRLATTTIGIERKTNPLLGLEDEDRFVEALLAAARAWSMPTWTAPRPLPADNTKAVTSAGARESSSVDAG